MYLVGIENVMSFSAGANGNRCGLFEPFFFVGIKTIMVLFALCLGEARENMGMRDNGNYKRINK